MHQKCFSMHRVFLLQVINRDMSIAVLRYFVQQREAELASGKLKKYQFTKKGGIMRTPTAPESEEKIPGLRVFEGLAASGLRSLRYAMEVCMPKTRILSC